MLMVKSVHFVCHDVADVTTKRSHAGCFSSLDKGHDIHRADMERPYGSLPHPFTFIEVQISLDTVFGGK